MIYVNKRIDEVDDGLIRSIFIGAGPLRLMFALSESNWYTKGKPRKIPVWVSRKGLFVYRFAIKFAWKRKNDASKEGSDD